MSLGEAVALCIIGILAIVLTIWAIIDTENKKVILEKSQRVNSLLSLNKIEQYIFQKFNLDIQTTKHAIQKDN